MNLSFDRRASLFSALRDWSIRYRPVFIICAARDRHLTAASQRILPIYFVTYVARRFVIPTK